MRNLIRADWYRTVRSGTLLWMLVVPAIIAGLFLVMILEPGTDFVAVGPGVPAAAYFLAAIVGAIACGNLAEDDFARGAARNKIVSGHTRAEVFWASYTVSTIIAYMSAGIFLVILMVPILQQAEIIQPDVMQTNILQAIPCTAAFTALYSLVGTIWPRRGTTAVNIIVLICLLAVSIFILSTLEQQPTYDFETVEYGEMGPVVIDSQQMPNPAYVKEPARSVYMFFNSFLPTGQVLQVMGDARMSFLPPYALGFWAVCCASGVLMLSRRNLQ